MLDVVLEFLSAEINAYLKARTGIDVDVVALSAIVDENGKYAIDNDSIGVNIINIEEECIHKEQLPKTTYQSGQHIVLEPKLNLNLSVMFAANYKHYDQALKYISYVMTYFQSHRLFVPADYASLDQSLKRVVVELQRLNYDQLNQVWAYIGAKQLPSAIYRVRMIGIQDAAANEVRPPILTIESTVGST
jgi:hypothetical protein